MHRVWTESLTKVKALRQSLEDEATLLEQFSTRGFGGDSQLLTSVGEVVSLSEAGPLHQYIEWVKTVADDDRITEAWPGAEGPNADEPPFEYAGLWDYKPDDLVNTVQAAHSHADGGRHYPRTRRISRALLLTRYPGGEGFPGFTSELFIKTYLEYGRPLVWLDKAIELHQAVVDGSLAYRNQVKALLVRLASAIDGVPATEEGEAEWAFLNEDGTIDLRKLQRATGVIRPNGTYDRSVGDPALIRLPEMMRSVSKVAKVHREDRALSSPKYGVAVPLRGARSSDGGGAEPQNGDAPPAVVTSGGGTPYDPVFQPSDGGSQAVFDVAPADSGSGDPPQKDPGSGGPTAAAATGSPIVVPGTSTVDQIEASFARLASMRHRLALRRGMESFYSGDSWRDRVPAGQRDAWEAGRESLRREVTQDYGLYGSEGAARVRSAGEMTAYDGEGILPRGVTPAIASGARRDQLLEIFAVEPAALDLAMRAGGFDRIETGAEAYRAFYGRSQDTRQLSLHLSRYVLPVTSEHVSRVTGTFRRLPREAQTALATQFQAFQRAEIEYRGALANLSSPASVEQGAPPRAWDATHPVADSEHTRRLALAAAQKLQALRTASRALVAAATGGDRGWLR